MKKSQFYVLLKLKICLFLNMLRSSCKKQFLFLEDGELTLFMDKCPVIAFPIVLSNETETVDRHKESINSSDILMCCRLWRGFRKECRRLTETKCTQAMSSEDSQTNFQVTTIVVARGMYACDLKPCLSRFLKQSCPSLTCFY